jgi:serine protease AprX
LSVGATNISNAIASFSSRGPATIDGSQWLKPDISAPGVNVRSSIRQGAYGVSSGTSMAGPHVAGLVALLISANPALAGQVDELEAIIRDTAVPLTTSQECGGVPGSQVPNHTFGYGLIDAVAAAADLPQRLSLTKSAPLLSAPGEALVYRLHVSHIHVVSATHNVVLTDIIPAGAAFVTATLPHTFDGTAVRWQKAALAPGETWQVELAVEVVAVHGRVENNDYAVYSDEVDLLFGLPVVTHIATHRLYLPLLNQQTGH